MYSTTPRVSDDGAFNLYFSMMLHIDDDDLDPFEYKLLGHYRKICGLYQTDTIFESNKTTAQATKMSVDKVRTARRSLASKGCIKLDATTGESIRVRLVNRMSENVQRYTPCQNQEGGYGKNDMGGMAKMTHDIRIKELKKEIPIANATKVASLAGDPLGRELDEVPRNKLLDQAKAKAAIGKLTSPEEKTEPIEPKKPKRAKQVSSVRSPLPTQYGDVFVAVRRCIYNADEKATSATSNRAGQDAKALLKEFPTITPDDVCEFANEWRSRKPGADIPRSTKLVSWFETYLKEWKRKETNVKIVIEVPSDDDWIAPSAAR